MEFNFNDHITDIQIHPKYPNLISVGIGGTIRYIRHDTIENYLYETRCVDAFAKEFCFTPSGDALIAILNEGEMRIFNEELNLQNIIFLDEDGRALEQPFVDANGANIGIDVLVGTVSGKILGYDTRLNSNKASITIENHTNTVNIIKSTDWWGCTSIADDGLVVLNDFRNERTAKSEFGPLKSIPKDLCICPYSKKMVVCINDLIYVFKSYDFDDGPLFEVSPFYDGTTPSACLSLSTNERPDLFGISYVDSQFITILDVNKRIWLRRHATKHIGSDLFAYSIRRFHGYTYFAADDTYFCVKWLDDIRDGGLCDDNDEEQSGVNEDEDNEDDIQAIITF